MEDIYANCDIFLILILLTIIVWFCKFKSNQNYFNNRDYFEPNTEIFLSFKDFKNFYNLNPNRYDILYNDENHVRVAIMKAKDGNNIKIKFKFFSFVKFYYWCKIQRKNKKNYENNQIKRRVLELVQNDIDNLRKQAEKEVAMAEKTTSEVGGRL